MKVIHAYPFHTPSFDSDKRRYQIAAYTWRSQKWIEHPVSDADLPRMFVEGKKTLPFVRDVIDHAAKDLLFDDVIVYTNSDTCVATDCLKKVLRRLKEVDALYVYRRDFTEFLDVIPDDKIKEGVEHVGSDLHAFKVSWWKRKRKEFPNLVLARIAPDAILRHLIDEDGQWPKTKLENLIYHQIHQAVWEQPENKFTLAGNRLNIELVNKFLEKRGIAPEKFKI
jgi:hypothetical protein